MQGIKFDYFRGMEADQYSFYRVPKALFTSDCFKLLSCEAKVLYGLMLDRMGLSIKNGWFDDENRVYIIFTLEQVMELLNCGRQKAVKTMAELDTGKGIGLIEKKRLGLGKPNVIYVKNFMLQDTDEPNMGDARSKEEEKRTETHVNMQKYENHTSVNMENELQEIPSCEKACFQRYENQTSGGMKTELLEVPRPYANETEYNKTKINKNQSNPSYPSIRGRENPLEGMDEMVLYRKVVKENIDYNCLLQENCYEKESLDELVELMVETMLMPDGDTLRISSVERPMDVVKNRFMEINHDHVQYVLTCLKENKTKVGNIKAYLLTTLYNATLTMSNYYQAEANHDLHEGLWSG